MISALPYITATFFALWTFTRFIDFVAEMSERSHRD